MSNILLKLENALTRNFLNIDIRNYSYGNFEGLFKLIEELANKSFTPCSYAIANTSINSGYIHIIAKEIEHQNAFENTLSILLSVQDFNVQDIEVSLLH